MFCCCAYVRSEMVVLLQSCLEVSFDWFHSSTDKSSVSHCPTGITGACTTSIGLLALWAVCCQGTFWTPQYKFWVGVIFFCSLGLFRTKFRSPGNLVLRAGCGYRTSGLLYEAIVLPRSPKERKGKCMVITIYKQVTVGIQEWGRLFCFLRGIDFSIPVQPRK